MRDLFAKWAAPAGRAPKTGVTGVTGVTAPPNPSLYQDLAATEAVTRGGEAGVIGVTAGRCASPTVTPVTRDGKAGVTGNVEGNQADNPSNPGYPPHHDAGSDASPAAAIDPVAGDGWGPEDWREFFEERAAVAEHDGGADREMAERWAFEACVTCWLNENAPPDDPTRCAYSGDPLPADGGDAVPVLRGGGGHAWVRLCHLEAWWARRRAGAVAVLARMRIGEP